MAPTATPMNGVGLLDMLDGTLDTRGMTSQTVQFEHPYQATNVRTSK